MMTNADLRDDQLLELDVGRAQAPLGRQLRSSAASSPTPWKLVKGCLDVKPAPQGAAEPLHIRVDKFGVVWLP